MSPLYKLHLEENAKFLTPKKIAQVNMAKRLLHALGYPSVVDLKTIIKVNTIWDNPVTKSDIKLMECLYGPNFPTINGKTTTQCLDKLVSDMVLILTNYVIPNEMYASILTSCTSMVCLF